MRVGQIVFRQAALVLTLIMLTGGFHPSSSGLQGSRGMVDLAVEEITYDENLTVSCRLASLGSAYSGSFYVNLSVNGDLVISEPQIMIDWMGTYNVTFQQRIEWDGPSVKVKVNIYDPQWAQDNDTSNDQRVEIWDRELPDLVVSSVFGDIGTGEAVARISNNGFAPATAPFNLTLSLNGSERSKIVIHEDLEPWMRRDIDLNWTWNGSDVNINVTVDSSDLLEEIEEKNSHYITWSVRKPLEFLDGPRVVDLGLTNATLVWNTSIPATSHILHRGQSEFVRSGVTHVVHQAKALKPETQYNLKVLITDQHGRRTESDMISFVTDPHQEREPPTLSMEKNLTFNWTDEMRIPMDIDDDVGIKKVDIYIDGKLAKSIAGTRKKSIRSLDLGKVSDNSHLISDPNRTIMKVMVTDDEGQTTGMDLPPMRFRVPFEVPYPRITWNPNTERRYDGNEFLMARCEDPGGMTNATWYVDDVQYDFDESRYPDSSYFGPYTTWDTSLLSDGVHTVTLEVRNHEGNVTRASRDLEVDNILPPANPEIWVRRANIRREGTLCTVRLNVTNHGPGDARNVEIVDMIKGFVPLDGEDGTSPRFGNGKEWSVHLSTPLVESGETVWLEYRAVPILYNEEEWVLGYDRPRHDDPSRTFTTAYSYERYDGDVSFSKSVSIPPANFEDGYTMEGGMRHMLSQSNYLMMTNPVLLLRSFVFGDGYFDTLAEVGELVTLKRGVFGFIDTRGGVSPSPEQILETLLEWKDLMHPDFDTGGYLCILGENEIIPFWTYENVVGDEDVEGSDQGYSNLNGGRARELIVGRILGNTPERLLEPIRTSIGVHQGTLINDNGGRGIVMSGSGGGVRSFWSSAEDLFWMLEDDMTDVDLYHRSAYLTREDSDLVFDGKSRHMDAGDLDGDGTAEVVVLDPDADTVYVHHPETGLTTDFTMEMTDGAQLQVGWLNYHDREMIAIFDDFPGESNDYKCMEENGTIHWSTNRHSYDADDPVALLDMNPFSISELIAVGDVDIDQIRVYDMFYNEQFSFDTANLRRNHRIDCADMDDDGDIDIVVADHHSDKVRVYRNPTWERFDIDVGSLDYSDGFGAGDFIPQRDGSRDEVAIVHSENGYLEPCWMNWDDDIDEWVGKSEKVHITPASADCAVAVTGMYGWDGYDEIILSIGGWADRTVVLDYANCSANYRNNMYSHVRNKDLIVYRDHGNEYAWSGLFGHRHLEECRFGDYRHRPVMVGFVCLSGRYHETDNSFAQSALRNGAGVYIGATEISYRSSNNNALQFTEDYAQGMPIGIAFKKMCRRMMLHASDMGLTSSGGRYWSYEYNLYGDPAFGTDGMPWAEDETRSLADTRSSVEISMETPHFINDTGGVRASIPGCSELKVQGEPVVPFVTYEFAMDEGETVDSVDVRMKGDPVYFEDKGIMIFDGPHIDGSGKKGQGSRQISPIQDPTTGMYPGEDMDWRLVEGPDGPLLEVTIYPLKVDRISGGAVFHGEWTLDIGKVNTTATISQWDCPGSAPQDERISFESVLEPVNGGGTVSISQRIEMDGDAFVEELPSSIMEINTTTDIEGYWDIEDRSGSFLYVMELRTIGGALMDMINVPFGVSGSGLSMGTLSVDPIEFGNGTTVNATVFAANDGDSTVELTYRFELLDNVSLPMYEVNGTVSVSPDSTGEIEAQFDMSGVDCDVCGIRVTLASDVTVLTGMKPLYREGSDDIPEVPQYHALMEFEHDREVQEGGTVSVIGNITRSDGKLLGGIPVAVWLGERNYTADAITGPNGSFRMDLLNLREGNWSLEIRALFGDEMLHGSSFIVIEGMDGPGNGDDDNGTSDDDDGDGGDTDDDTGEDDDDTETDGEEGNDEDQNNGLLLVWVLIALIIIIILIGAFVLISRKTADEAGDILEE